MSDLKKTVKYDVIFSLEAGKATPAPPVGTVLGPAEININEFCKRFNEWSKNYNGVIAIGVLVFDDGSFDILSEKEYLKYKKSVLNSSLSSFYHKWEDEINEKSIKSL